MRNVGGMLGCLVYFVMDRILDETVFRHKILFACSRLQRSNSTGVQQVGLANS
jgi:hypothetical protein